MTDYVFWGATGQARVLADILALTGDRLVALFDNSPNAISPFAEIPLFLGSEGFATWWASTDTSRLPQAVIAIGGALGQDRCEIGRQLAAAGLVLATLKHPQAIVSGEASLGNGCQILAGCVIGTGAILGNHVIVNTRASVDHECELGDGVHVAPGATLCGCVSVGQHTLIGPGSVVLPRVNIGKNVIVGAGSVVTHDLPDNVSVWGVPARKQRENI
jgi:sugar O-acyltransferase (sialic acid O-acetyltransferase NeuD family)